jgi:hypothetical protein
MNTKTLVICAALAATFASTLAPAQGNGVARLKDVKGNVLVSQQSGLAAGGEAARLAEHTRVITTAGAEVIVVYDNGCEVRLKENQRFQVEMDKPCAALLAESLFTAPPATAGIGIAGLLLPAAGVGVATDVAGITTAILGKTPTPSQQSLSPN